MACVVWRGEGLLIFQFLFGNALIRLISIGTIAFPSVTGEIEMCVLRDSDGSASVANLLKSAIALPAGAK
jgi:hypothetical protein